MLFDPENGRAREFVNPYATSDKAGSAFRQRIVGLFGDATAIHSSLLSEKMPISEALEQITTIGCAYMSFCDIKTSERSKRKADKELQSALMDKYEENRGARPFLGQPCTSDLSFTAAPSLLVATVSTGGLRLSSPAFGATTPNSRSQTPVPPPPKEMGTRLRSLS